MAWNGLWWWRRIWESKSASFDGWRVGRTVSFRGEKASLSDEKVWFWMEEEEERRRERRAVEEMSKDGWW